MIERMKLKETTRTVKTAILDIISEKLEEDFLNLEDLVLSISTHYIDNFGEKGASLDYQLERAGIDTVKKLKDIVIYFVFTYKKEQEAL